MIKHHQVKAILLVMSLSACAGNQAPEILTDEKFSTRITEQGQTEFVYGLSWKNTSQASLLRDGRQEIERPKRDREYFPVKQDRMALQANNQTKLDLEDQAANALKQKLTQQKLCAKGYEITDVLWKEQNIRLLGHCL
ncbi:hypothetical protein [Paraglaciecola aestuariivivens]